MKHLILIGIASLYTFLIRAQCNEHRHTTEGFDGWVSCNTSTNPKSSRGNTHWMRYNFDEATKLYDVRVWNMNHPDYLDDGVKDVIVEYKPNTSSGWILVDTFSIPKANASSNYTGRFVFDLKGLNVRQLLFTPISNYGGGCMALSAVQIFKAPYVEETVTRFFKTCEGEEMYKNLKGGTSSTVGRGVIDNGDGTYNFDVMTAGIGVHPIVYMNGNQQVNGNITVLPCSDRLCTECLQCGNPLNIAIDNIPVPSGSYFAHQLESKGRVNGVGEVLFWGGNSVTLNPGFEVRTSGQLEADIRPCMLNSVLNPSYESNGDDWSFGTNSDATATVSYPSNIEVMEGDKAARVNVTQAGNWYGDVRLGSRDRTVIKDKRYRVSFAARSNVYGKRILVQVQNQQSPYNSIGEVYYTLNTNWQRYSYEFVASETRDEEAQLRFLVGRFTGVYFFDDVRFSEVN